MDDYLQMSPLLQREACERAGDQLGLTPAAVEKDYWVCWVLRELFRMNPGVHLTFKGGTSLSKCWGAIKRFSEDIDLVVDRGVLGFAGDAAPEAGISRRERERRADAVSHACREFVARVLLPELLDRSRTMQVVLDPEVNDQQTILCSYDSRFTASGYLRPVVKVELGARSDIEPTREPEIEPYVAQAAGLVRSRFRVRAVAPERTFWEKVSLLHEMEVGARSSTARLSRHYYDLWSLAQRGIAASALNSPELFIRVAQHRRLYFRRAAAAQRTLQIGSVRLVPSDERMPGWRADFEAMRESMFFEEPPRFETIIEAARLLEQQINQLTIPG